ncbi:MAG: DUF6382 domain-containing protein [Lachnospiraceae bacterium]|nr:DUF6382 domain-containing protein [Lachnospiraceae bacterium]
MKTEYKRDLQNNYLILEVPEADAEDGYGLRMAEQNQVKGLLPMHESRRDGKLYLHYEITSRQTLESVYEKKVMSYQDILTILSGIRDTLEDMRKYLLSPQKLLFAPELIYVPPEKKGLQLCYYAKEDEYPITMLAEFILKRLDHRDRQAVTLGYVFFQQANSANFSLTGALKDIFVGIRMTGEQSAANVSTSTDGGRIPVAAIAGMPQRSERFSDRRTNNVVEPEARDMTGAGGSPACDRGLAQRGRTAVGDGSLPQGSRSAGNGGLAQGSRSARNSGGLPQGGRTVWGDGSSESDGLAGGRESVLNSEIVRSRDSVRGGETTQSSGTGGTGGWNASPKSSFDSDGDKELFYDAGTIDDDGIFVTHRERKKQKNRPDLADRLFQIIHPAVLLTFLLLLIGLEVVFAFEILGLTETGGCFFLILTVEILLNHRLLRKDQDDREMPEWDDEENEDYERIMQEVYQQEPCAKPEEIEETRCLIPNETVAKLHLVCARRGTGMEGDRRLEDIHPGTDPVYIGKIKGEADIILRASTVSRMHARIQIREGLCFLKDMNSKNGTFVNGERLNPQEEREIKEGDTVSFADVEYHVIKS